MAPRRSRRDLSLVRARQIIFDRKTPQLIRARKGVLSLAELVEQTGLSLARAREEMRRLCESYGGEPHSGLDGHVVYAFPELMTTLNSRLDVKEPRPAWVRFDDPMDHARTARSRVGLGLLSIGVGAAALTGAPVLLATSGELGALGALAGGSLALAVGVRSVLRHHPYFRFRQVRTLRRYALGHVVETALAGKGVVSLQRTVRFIQGRAGKRRVKRSAVEAALRELAREFDAPITIEGDDLFFGFRHVKRQFLASRLVRKSLSLGRSVHGQTVFDSGDSPLEATERELAAFDSELARRGVVGDPTGPPGAEGVADDTRGGETV